MSDTVPLGSAPLLAVDGFSVRLRLPYGELHACENVSFDLQAGESLGVVGESGSGKSVTMLSMMGLIRGRKEGTLHFKGARMEDLSPLRGRDVSMVCFALFFLPCLWSHRLSLCFLLGFYI